MKLFQYAILWLPNSEESKQGIKPKILLDITSMIAASEQQVLIAAATQIPDEYKGMTEQIQIPISAF